VLEDERNKQRGNVLDTLEKNQVRKGIVKNITEFGAFIDLGGGVKGLLHITDMSYERIDDPKEIVQLGQEVEVVILDFNDKKERISLGIKQLHQHPWKERYPKGMKVKSKIVSVTDYAAFVELEKGLKGLIHVSEMSWSNHLPHPNKLFTVGQEIEAVVLNEYIEGKQIPLGIKQLETDPWESIESELLPGTKVIGEVRSIATFGAFVEIKDGVDGLIEHPGEMIKKGDKVECVVLAVDSERRSISLSMKHLGNDPWNGGDTSPKIIRDINGWTRLAKLQEFSGKGVTFTLRECEKNGINSYEILDILHIGKYKGMLDNIWRNQIKRILLKRDIVGIQKIVDGGWASEEDFFLVFENNEEVSNLSPLEIMRNIAIGLNELKLKDKQECFIISPKTIKNELQFVGLFELFDELDLLDEKYLSSNVNEWRKDHQKANRPNFQDDIYSLVKSFEKYLEEVGNDDAKKILDKVLAKEEEDVFSRYSDLIGLLNNICIKKLQVQSDNPSEVQPILDEMNKYCELSVGSKNKRGQIVVSFYTDKWQGTFNVDNDYVYIPFQYCRHRIDFRNKPEWFVADFSFSIDEKSTIDFSIFTKKFDERHNISNSYETREKNVEKWRTMPEKEKEFIEENAFSVSYKEVEIRGIKAIFSLTDNLNDKTWDIMKKHKNDGTILYTDSANRPREMVRIGKILEFDYKTVTIRDIRFAKEEIYEKGTLVEIIIQKITPFKKQVEACAKFLKGDMVNDKFNSILANDDPEVEYPYSKDNKELKEWDYKDFKEKVFNPNLKTDETQLRAVLEAISYKPIYLIQGPPGTGKTTVIVECIRQIIEREPNSKILVTSQSNLAVDNVLEKILEVKPELKFMRLASESEDREMNVTEAIKPHTYRAKLERWVDKTRENHIEFIKNKFMDKEQDEDIFNFRKKVKDIEFNKFKEELNKERKYPIKKLFENSNPGSMGDVNKTFEDFFSKEYLELKDIGGDWKAFLTNATEKNLELQSKINNGSEEIGFLPAMIEDMSIIGATCIHIASSKYKGFKFDYVFIDESSKASPAEALVPINMGRNIILIGDHKQLPPVVTREDAVKQKVREKLEDNGLDIEKEFGESLFEKKIMQFEKSEEKQKCIRMLNIQYRMPKQIGSLISKNFYDGKLENPLPEVIPDFDEKHKLDLKLKIDTSIVFFRTSENDNGNKFKRENEGNVKRIKEILVKLDERCADKPIKPTVGIIAGYRGQVELLRRSIITEQYKNCLVEINTVDKFQGAERDIIIYDIVRSESSNANIGFLDDDRRINVAFSRAKCFLIIVGNSEYIKKARPNPGETGIYKQFKLQNIVKDLDKEKLVFNDLEEVF